WGRTLSEFFVSRVSRLVPAYVFAVLLTSAVLTLWPYAHNRPDAARVLYHTTMMEQFLNVPWIDTVYWTLFVELKFYLLFSIVSFPKSAVLLVAFFAVMVAAALGRLSWLRWRGFAILDALTYPLYLTHAELSRAVLHRFHASVPPVVLLLAFLAGALLLAFAVNRLVERPVASYIRRGLRASFRQIRAADH